MGTYTTVGLINKALILCGANTITALTDSTEQARICNEIYDDTRKELLCECMWSFATTRSNLATVASTTIQWFHTNEAYVYTRPSAALKIFAIDPDTAEWREEYGYIISDSASLGAKYVVDHTEVGLWSPSFAKAFIDKLCSEISYTLLNSTTKAQAFLEKYEKITLPKAMTENSQIGTQQIMTDDAWVDARTQNQTPEA